MVSNKFVDADRMNLYLLFEPKEFNLANLPLPVKEKTMKQFQDLEAGFLSTLPETSRIMEHIRSVTNYILSAGDTAPEVFQRSVSRIDALRNENFVTTFPELAELMGQAE